MSEAVGVLESHPFRKNAKGWVIRPYLIAAQENTLARVSANRWSGIQHSIAA